jgi:hypothetical protein
MDLFESLQLTDDTEREAIRSAVILAKIRYDEQVSPFVGTDKQRLASEVVQNELSRIVDETSTETGADSAKVRAKLETILADVVLPVSQPKKENVTDVGDEPPKANEKDVPAPEDHASVMTDVKDRGAVLEDEILEPKGFKRIDVQGSCVRCQKNAAVDSVVCDECNDELVKEAARKEGVGWAPYTPPVGQPQTQQPTMQTQQQPGTTPAPTQGQVPAMTPLNPNAPYQCNACGRTGTFDDIMAHINQATDTQHMQYKQQQQQGQQGQPQQATGGAYEDQVKQPEVKGDDNATTPASQFDQVVQSEANKAAARHFSMIDPQTVSDIASTYGLDENTVRDQLVRVADFGDFHAVNGIISDQQVPEDYTELTLDNDQDNSQVDRHEAIVATNSAIRRVADNLGMDANTVYAAVKDQYGDDLSDQYHIAVQGDYHYYLPRNVMESATQHPQPSPPPQQQPQTMPAQPQQQPMPQQMSSLLSERGRELLLERDAGLEQRRARRKRARSLLIWQKQLASNSSET